MADFGTAVNMGALADVGTSPQRGVATLQAMQTSPTEVAFRWNGLTEWINRGLTYWWFDRNWGFSIPPPFVNCTGNTCPSGQSWEGLDNAVWGSHVYHSVVKTVHEKLGQRAVTLTKYAPGNEKPDYIQHEHSAQRRC